MIDERKRYKAAGYAVFFLSAGLLLCRVLAYFIYRALADTSLSQPVQELLLDVIFSVPAQILFCFLMPLLIYKKYQGLPVRTIFAESSFKKTKLWILGISVIIGVAALVLTIVVSGLWLFIITLFGYSYGSSGTAFPDKFNAGFFLASLFLTAVLPAFCEEFAIRGTFLTTMRKTFAGTSIIIVMGLSFGLFHQEITQLVYTALFGGFMAYLVIKTGSIYPAIIIHFVNNGLSVFMDYASNYGWGGGFVDKFFDLINSNGLASAIFIGAIAAGVIALLTMLIVKKSKTYKPEAPVATLYKPSTRESAFYIGAIVMTAVSTIFTFCFGY